MIGRELDVGVGGVGAMNITGGGVVSDGNANLAYDSNSTGTVLVSGDGSTWSNGGALVVGYSADGSMTIAAGGQVTSGMGSITAFGTHTAAVTVDGAGSGSTSSKWSVSGRLDVGRNDGTNTLDIINGGQVSDNFGYIAPAGSNATGAVTVDGANSQWTNSGNLIIAEGGPDGEGDTGSLAITNGGRVRNSTACIGCGAGASGAVTVAGTNSNWNNTALLYVGEGGDGSLDISAGGSINADSVYIGNDTGSTGVVSISGAGSGEINSSSFIVGEQGNGTFNVGDAADVSVQGLIVGDIANGVANISNATLHTGGEVDVANLGGSTGTVMLTDGGRWDHTGSTPSDVLVVGKYGGGELDVLSGSQMNLQGQAPVVLGEQTGGGQGTVNIDGAMSQLSVELQYVDVGEQGAGTIHVTAGGSVLASNSDVGVAVQGGSTGVISVDGAGSTIEAGMLEVGRAGTGELHVAGGATVTTPVITFASEMGSSGMGTVDGTDSTLSATTGMGQIIVGGNDQASLTVSGGALAEALQVIIGDGNNANGTMLVTGSGSELHATDEVLVGFSGVGSLTVSTGASVISPTVTVNDQSSIGGNGTIVGDLDNHGTVAPGASPGALHVDGNYTQPSTGHLQIEIGGLTAASDYDQLLVTSDVTLDGTLQVSLINSFMPAVGNSFDILDFVGRTGTFATLDLPTLPSNLAWNTTQLYSNGIISIALAGDFNFDGQVDAADYVVWRKGLGSTYMQSDYDVWRANFGTTVGSSAANASAVAVPEPRAASLTVLAWGIILLYARWKR
jgi:fibronectin-binding autotransporter adhesin